MSCGGSGVVRLWNTVHSRLVGQFTAHDGDLGSVVMAVSPCGKYLVTADREGTLKTWDIQVGVLYLVCQLQWTTLIHTETTRHRDICENKRDKDRESDGDW